MRLLAVFAWFGALLLPAAAELEAWLRIGDEIEGESIHPNHAGWSDLEGFSVDPSKERFTMTCHKPIDRASTLFVKACVDGSRFETAVIEAARPVGEESREFWRLRLRDVQIIACERTGDQAGAMELVRLTWKAHTVDYRVFPDSGPEYDISRLVSPDGDRDKLPDAYETDHGLDPTKSNFGKDSDGDGLTDEEEYRLGTKPNDPTSFFFAKASDDDPGDEEIQLTFPTVSGEKYRVLFSPDLVTPFAEIAEIRAIAAETTYNATRILPVGFFRIEPSEEP